MSTGKNLIKPANDPYGRPLGYGSTGSVAWAPPAGHATADGQIRQAAACETGMTARKQGPRPAGVR
jgi:hypothetical protein